jgi:hypothetical protein
MVGSMCFRLPLRHRHDAPGRKRKAGPPTTRLVILPQAARLRGGAPGGAAVRWRGLASLQITARARLGMGLANHPCKARGVSGVTHRRPIGGAP